MALDKPATFFTGQEIIEINSRQIAELKDAAKKMPLRRARLCLHQGASDKVHEMIIAFCKDSYVRPHRHINKSESFHVIEGELLVVFFDEKGNIIRKVKMGPYGSGLTFVYRLASNLWHMVVPLTEFMILHESTPGPFIKEEAEFPGWAPKDNDKAAIADFIQKIIG